MIYIARSFLYTKFYAKLTRDFADERVLEKVFRIYLNCVVMDKCDKISCICEITKAFLSKMDVILFYRYVHSCIKYTYLVFPLKILSHYVMCSCRFIIFKLYTFYSACYKEPETGDLMLSRWKPSQVVSIIHRTQSFSVRKFFSLALIKRSILNCRFHSFYILYLNIAIFHDSTHSRTDFTAHYFHIYSIFQICSQIFFTSLYFYWQILNSNDQLVI